MSDLPYDSLLIVSFGGPESRDDVMPFLENVLRGKNVPRERMLEVAEHYEQFSGVSPINAQTRALIEALQSELDSAGIDLPVYWGNRNWHPFLRDTLREMAAAGLRRSLAYITSAYSSYSGCRQYREDIESARQQVSNAPTVDKTRVFYNHPGFVDANVERIREAIQAVAKSDNPAPLVLFTAHSIPLRMAENCDYEKQLCETVRLICERLELANHQLVYQSRSGPPQQPWLEPDVCDAIEQAVRRDGARSIVIAPIGFLSDHLEVLYDLDIEARAKCDELGVRMARAGTVGTHPRFVRMIRELFEERLLGGVEKLALGEYGPNHDVCPVDCCAYTPSRPPQS